MLCKIRAKGNLLGPTRKGMSRHRLGTCLLVVGRIASYHYSRPSLTLRILSFPSKIWAFLKNILFANQQWHWSYYVGHKKIVKLSPSQKFANDWKLWHPFSLIEVFKQRIHALKRDSAKRLGLLVQKTILKSKYSVNNPWERWIVNTEDEFL